VRKLSAWLFMGILFSFCAHAADEKSTSALIFFDAGAPVKLEEGRYGADFGRFLLALSGQVRVTGNFFGEFAFTYFPTPGQSRATGHGFELNLNGMWKFLSARKVNPFIKLGISYAWNRYRNSYFEIFYPAPVWQSDRWLGVTAGAGIESRLSRALLLRLGGAMTYVPNDGEGGRPVWLRFFIGIGYRFAIHPKVEIKATEFN